MDLVPEIQIRWPRRIVGPSRSLYSKRLFKQLLRHLHAHSDGSVCTKYLCNSRRWHRQHLVDWLSYDLQIWKCVTDICATNGELTLWTSNYGSCTSGRTLMSNAVNRFRTQTSTWLKNVRPAKCFSVNVMFIDFYSNFWSPHVYLSLLPLLAPTAKRYTVLLDLLDR